MQHEDTWWVTWHRLRTRQVPRANWCRCICETVNAWFFVNTYGKVLNQNCNSNFFLKLLGCHWSSSGYSNEVTNLQKVHKLPDMFNFPVRYAIRGFMSARRIDFQLNSVVVTITSCWPWYLVSSFIRRTQLRMVRRNVCLTSVKVKTTVQLTLVTLSGTRRYFIKLNISLAELDNNWIKKKQKSHNVMRQ